MTISQKEALQLAEKHVSSIYGEDMTVVFLRELSVGWVFYYNSSKYMKTKLDSDFFWGCRLLVVTFEGDGYVSSAYWDGKDEEYVKRLVVEKPDFLCDLETILSVTRCPYWWNRA